MVTTPASVKGPALKKGEKMKRTEAGIAAQKAFLAARTKAYRRLAQLHPEEFRALCDEERQALGYEPLPMGRPRVNA